MNMITSHHVRTCALMHLLHRAPAHLQLWTEIKGNFREQLLLHAEKLICNHMKEQNLITVQVLVTCMITQRSPIAK